VDSAAVQDGFDLYLHGFVVTDAGQWVVIQQGMNGECQQARRYHWLSEGLKSFVDEPHAAIDGVGQGEIIKTGASWAAIARLASSSDTKVRWRKGASTRRSTWSTPLIGGWVFRLRC
jgi:hypothetical protein